MENLSTTIYKTIQELAPIADKMGLKLYGHVTGIVKRAKTGKEEVVFDHSNIIINDLKGLLRDTMNSNVDLSLDNLQATQVLAADLSASYNNKDGLILHTTNPGIFSGILGFMASAVHPTDPSGDFYRQWQGVLQNLTGGTISPASALIGHIYTHGTGTDGVFDKEFATTTYSTVTLLDNDIITINWKITVG